MVHPIVFISCLSTVVVIGKHSAGWRRGHGEIDAADSDGNIAATLAMGPVKTSMWQDIEAGRVSEVDYINGYVANRAEMPGVNVPVNHMLVTLTHALGACRSYE